MGFAQGKTMLVRRRDLARAGGIHALADEIAEDAAATKLVAAHRAARAPRRCALRAAARPAPARQVWDRQTRWARLRRISFPRYFAAEILTGCLLPLAAAAYVADAVDMPASVLVAALAAVWFGSEALLARAAGWHLSLGPLSLGAP